MNHLLRELIVFLWMTLVVPYSSGFIMQTKVFRPTNALKALPSVRVLHRTTTMDFRSTTTKSSWSSLKMFDKFFEEEGLLGKGITVGKVQVALMSFDRSKDSIYSILERAVADCGDTNEELAGLANKICLELLRKSDDWISACSTSKWFSENDPGKAESFFNTLANAEAVKYEKEYKADGVSTDEKGSPTAVVVSVILEIQGDATKFDGAGFSVARTKEVLASIASDCAVDDGYCVNAVEVFWTPSDKSEVLQKNDLILDFPELIDL